MRKLYLIDEESNTYYFSFKNKVLVSGISDLGFSNDLVYLTYENERVLTEEKNARTSIDLDLVFLNGYQGYTDFIEYKSKIVGRLKLCYEIKNATKYVYVAIQRLTKRELEACVLKCSLTLDKLSVWYKDISSTILITEPSEGKKYTYTYPYTYGNGYQGEVEITNNGELKAGLFLHINGSVKNPRVVVSKDSKIVSQMRLIIEAADCDIYISSTADNQFMLMTKNGITENIYSKQDFTYDNFLFIEPGTYTVWFDPGVDDEGTSCTISFKEGYSGH